MSRIVGPAMSKSRLKEIFKDVSLVNLIIISQMHPTNSSYRERLEAKFENLVWGMRINERSAVLRRLNTLLRVTHKQAYDSAVKECNRYEGYTTIIKLYNKYKSSSLSVKVSSKNG